MVRHKNRYMVIEITQQGQTDQELAIQRSSLRSAVLETVQRLHGDFGVAAITAGLSEKYCNEKTRIAVIRCRHGPHRFVTSALPCIKSIEKKTVRVTTLYVGATIRQCFKFLQRHQQIKLDEFCLTLKTDREKEAMKKKVFDLKNVLNM